MNILFIGDVVGSIGCDFLRKHLSVLKRHYGADIVIVNGENSANGNGITPLSAEHIFTSGADVITTGNHIFRRREIYEFLEQNSYILRPVNCYGQVPGRGYLIYDFGKHSVAIINLIGTVYMDNNPNPFYEMDTLLSRLNQNIVIVDFHAEATAEKIALANYLDGRVTAVLGTHTHVQTADETILPKGTGYITDVGMTGPIHSVLGVKPELAIKKMMNNMPVRFENAEGDCAINGVLLEIDESLGITTKINRLNII